MGSEDSAALNRANAAYDIAVANRADLAAHMRTCEAAAERNGERIEEANARIGAVDRKIDALQQERRDDRKAELVERQERQKTVDQQFKELREFQRRVGIAVVVACIMVIGAVMGSALKPFIEPAVAAAKLIGGS